jgi:hypothetical protein
MVQLIGARRRAAWARVGLPWIQARGVAVMATGDALRGSRTLIRL